MSYAPIFKWASWWKSDDIFSGIPDSFQESQNIEIRENSKSIKLTKKLVKDSLAVVTEIINCFIKVSNWNILAFWNSWWVYRKTWWVWYKNSNTITWAILSAIEFNWYVYLTNSTKLYRVAVTDLSNIMTFTEYKTFTTSSIYHPMVILENTLYIWDKFNIAYLDNLWDWDWAFFEVNKETVIKYLKIQWNNIKIYSEDIYWNTLLIYWDSINTAPIETIPLNWIKIEQLIDKDWYDYVVSNNKIWIRDWLKIETLKEISIYSTNINSCTIKKNRILYWWIWSVWEWGWLNKNYPEVLSNSYTTSNALTDIIWAIFYDWTDLYVSWSNWSTYWIDKLSNTSYNTNWYIITRAYYWNIKSIRKYSNNVLTAFQKLAWTDNIKIYYRTQITWNYTLLQTLTATSTKINDYCDMIQLAQEFNFIEFKIELNGWTTTPEFYELFLELDDLI